MQDPETGSLALSNLYSALPTLGGVPQTSYDGFSPVPIDPQLLSVSSEGGVYQAQYQSQSAFFPTDTVGWAAYDPDQYTTVDPMLSDAPQAYPMYYGY